MFEGIVALFSGIIGIIIIAAILSRLRRIADSVESIERNMRRQDGTEEVVIPGGLWKCSKCEEVNQPSAEKCSFCHKSRIA
jgi:hypothetical protein